jgi:hypothetical protein
MYRISSIRDKLSTQLCINGLRAVPYFNMFRQPVVAKLPYDYL